MSDVPWLEQDVKRKREQQITALAQIMPDPPIPEEPYNPLGARDDRLDPLARMLRGPSLNERVVENRVTPPNPQVDTSGGRFQPNIQAPGGRLVTQGLWPERYRIRPTGIPSGYRVKSVTVGGRDVTVEGFDLVDGPIDGMIITLTKRLTEVTGVVRDAQDRPDGEAAVVAFPTDRRLWTETGQVPVFIENVHVSQKGNYSVKGLPAGEYFVVATRSDPFLTTDAETLGRLAPLAERIRLADGQALTLNLRTRN